MVKGLKVCTLVTLFGDPYVLYYVIKSDTLRTIVLPIDAGMAEEHDTDNVIPFTVPSATW